MRIRLTKILTFEMAHALPGYDGACRHIHGHSFRLEVCVLGEPLQAHGHPKNGMVMDFKILKSIVNESFVNIYDHALVLPETTASDIVDGLQRHFGNVITLPFQPTCENMIAICVETLRPKMPSGVTLWSVKLSETASSFAEWCVADEKGS
ncbi:MAG: 6-carboxytetrahydropterin synthase [Saprospiraceae bacterium]|nr:6-carboxytetrahydropterin synthase [Saprospiraceae bacterium]